MSSERVLNMQDELNQVKTERSHLMCQVDELQAVILKREEELKQVEDTIRTLRDRVRFLEGQVNAYQYCLNCRR